MPSRSSQREARPTLRSDRTPTIPILPPKPENPETNRGLINISKFNGPNLASPDPTTIPKLQFLNFCKVFCHLDCFSITQMYNNYTTCSFNEVHIYYVLCNC